jgi:hypothetical protein
MENGKKSKNFFYDDFSDRLMISNKKPEERVIGSARLLNATLDFTSSDKIVNIEIRNISDYLKSIEIDTSILKELISAEIKYKQYHDGYMIYIILSSPSKTEKIPFNVPMQITA